MIRFHNRVVDSLPGSVPTAQRFAKARELVTKHYQWMIRTDYLPRICRPSPVDDVFTNGRKVFEVGATPTDVPTMPIEFSVAAFRLGHCMVRASYNWNKIFDDGAGTPRPAVHVLGHRAATSAAGCTLPSNWIADFRRLYDFERGRPADLGVPASKFNRAKAHRHAHRRPARATSRRRRSAAPAIPSGDPQRNLAFRNLTRAKHGEARDRPADGDVHEGQGRHVTGSRRRRSATARAASMLDTLSAEAAHRRARRTRRCGSTSCARPSSTAAG